MCYRPMSAIRYSFIGESRSVIKFYPDRSLDRKNSVRAENVRLACGKCSECKLKYSKSWAIRCMHEASLWPINSFITLTYSDENLPHGGTLVKKHHQDFMKRLREKFHGYGIDDNGRAPIRFFHCGEYGDKLSRPHYHTCLFNFDFKDRKYFKSSKRGDRYYISDELTRLWGHGHALTADFSWRTAAYVARYVMKKVTGDLASEHYLSQPDEDGVYYEIIPEYLSMSRKPGIGKAWFDKFHTEVYGTNSAVFSDPLYDLPDSVILEGREVRPPRYYDNILKQIDPLLFDAIAFQRYLKQTQRADDESASGLAAREAIAQAKLKMLRRPYENVQHL